MGAAAFEYVTLSVDGYVLMGFQEVEVERSMQQGAISFSCLATASSWSPQAMTLRQGKDVEIRSSLDLDTARAGGGDLLCKGAIDTYEVQIGEEGHKAVKISGRSKSRDAVDCPPVNHKTGRVENKTLLEAAQDFDEFGIGYTSDQQLDKIPMIQRQPHEPLHHTIERVARRLGYMLAAQPDGSVMITRAGTKRHAGAIVENSSPVRKLGIHIAPHAERSPIVVRGQKRLGHGKASLRQEQRYTKGTKHRPHLILAEGDHTKKDLKTRAQWESLRRAGYSMQVSPHVSRWRDDGGVFWTPGWLLPVSVPSENIEQDLTISSVKFWQKLGDKGGTVAELSLVDPKAHGGQAGMGSSDPVFDAGDAIS